MNHAIILAGGKGERFAGNIPKQFVKMTGKPMLHYSLRTAQTSPHVDTICVVAPPAYHDEIRKWAAEAQVTKPLRLAKAGKQRYLSVESGLREIPAEPHDTVLVMTAVCPFVSQRTMDKLYDKIEQYEACITVVKAVDAITFSNNGKEAARTMQKKKMFVQQGPQIYRYDILKKAHEAYLADENRIEVNEDSELVMKQGVECGMVLGDRFCLKVTYPEDLAIVEALYPLFRQHERELAEVEASYA